MQRSMSLPRAVSPAPCGKPFVRFFALHKVSHALRAIKIRHWHVRFLSETNIRKKADGKKLRGRDWEAYRAGELSARPVWCFRPPPVGRPGRSHRPVLEGGWDSHFLAFSLGLARSHLGSGRGEDRLGLASVLVTCWLLSIHCRRDVGIDL